MIAGGTTPLDEAVFSRACHTIYSPNVMTRLLWEAVPVLKSCNFQITKVKPGFAETRLPLNHATTNQHGTHQAALISLSADYTGGMALTTTFAGDPLAGIHRCDSDESASLWLVGMDMRYHKPSTGHMTGTCRIAPGLFSKLSRRYHAGKRVLVPLQVEFRSDGDLVATGELKYYAQTTSSLQKPSGGKISSLVEQKLKASSRMIAGIRAMAATSRKVSFTAGEKTHYMECENPAIHAAGAHGMLLAEKMMGKLPQLATFVRSRTQHIDGTISQLDDLKQIVLVGAGLDLRTLLHSQLRPELETFELDLPEMLAERDKVIGQIDASKRLKRTAVPCDFVNQSISQRVLETSNFIASRKTMLIYEGCSMYFSDDVNRKILNDLKSLMVHPESILWVDFVSEEILGGKTTDQGVADFLDAMAELGEQFVFGKSDGDRFLRDLGFSPQEFVTTADYLRNQGKFSKDTVYDQYRFCVASANNKTDGCKWSN